MATLIEVNLVLFALSFLSGMLGLGVAFVAIPALGLAPGGPAGHRPLELGGDFQWCGT